MVNMKKILIHLSLAVLCFGICTIIVLFFSKNALIRGFLGDIIVVMLIYFLLRSVGIFRPTTTAIIVLIIAFLTELLQYVNILGIIGLNNNKIAQLIFGSVFDPMDLLAYTIGVIAVYIIDKKVLGTL